MDSDLKVFTYFQVNDAQPLGFDYLFNHKSLFSIFSPQVLLTWNFCNVKTGIYPLAKKQDCNITL